MIKPPRLQLGEAEPENRAVVFAPIVVLALLAIVGVIWAARSAGPPGKAVTMQGVVERVGLLGGSRSTPSPYAEVKLADRTIIVGLNYKNRCKVGDSININHQRGIWGMEYTASNPSCEPQAKDI